MSHEPFTTESAAAVASEQASATRRISERLSRLVSGFRLDVAGTVATQLIAFGLQALHSIFLARLLGPVGRGEYGTVVFFSQLLLYAGTLGTLYTIARRAGQNSEDRKPLANAALRSGFTTGILCFLIVCVLSFVALPEGKQYLAPLCIVAALLLPFEHARLTLLAVDHGSGKFRRYNINRLISAATFLLLLLGAWATGYVSLHVVVGLFVLTPILALTSLLRMHTEVGLGRPSSPSVGKLLTESIPYASAYFATQLLARLDTLLVLWFLALGDQGQYMVALAICGLLAIVPNALALFSFNIGAKKEAQHTTGKLALGCCGVLLVQCLSGVILGFMLLPLVQFLFGTDFASCAPMVMIMIPGLALDGVATVAEGYLRGKGRPLSTLRARVLGAVLLVGVSLILLPQTQTLAIPIGVSVGHAFSALAIVWIAFRTNSAPAVEEDGSE